MPSCEINDNQWHVLWLWNLDWAFQFLQAKNWKTTKFGSNKVTKIGSYTKATNLGFLPDEAHFCNAFSDTNQSFLSSDMFC